MRIESRTKHFFEYKGSSLRPKDFDAYWEDALKEVNALDYKEKFSRKEFPSQFADMYELRYTGTKGARIYAKVCMPKNIEGKIPAVLMFHGLSGASFDWCELLKYVSQGYLVAFMDVRGQGGMSEDVGGVLGNTYTMPFLRGIEGEKHDLLMRDVFLDTVILARIIMRLDYVDENRIAVTGGSQGGALSVVCASLVPQIKKCGIFYPYLSDYGYAIDHETKGLAYEGLNYYFRSFDPTHEHVEELLEKLGYIDIQNFAKWMKAELLMFTGLRDASCPPITQFAMYNKVTAPKNVIFYPEYGHEGMKGAEDILFTFLSDL
ncbi:MAG: acetylxylan esterase [Ruminococcaceae bacterium]|nr:acetylxylan esterase [Oscillospiraceae bacterium]